MKKRIRKYCLKSRQCFKFNLQNINKTKYKNSNDWEKWDSNFLGKDVRLWLKNDVIWLTGEVIPNRKVDHT